MCRNSMLIEGWIGLFRNISSSADLAVAFVRVIDTNITSAGTLRKRTKMNEVPIQILYAKKLFWTDSLLHTHTPVIKLMAFITNKQKKNA